MASTATKSTSFRQTMLFLMTFLLVLLLEPCRSQSSSNNNYDNYGYEGDGAGDGYGSDAPDNLYHDYAARQQEKGVGANGVAAAAGGGWPRVLMGGAVGWLVGGKFHSSRVAKRLQEKHKRDQKVLYQQYYNDVYTLQQQNEELLKALEKQYGYGSSGNAAGTGGGSPVRR